MTSFEAVSMLIDANLLTQLRQTYTMDWEGFHGFAHWCRVRENGLRLAEINGANSKVIEYFAFFHDNQRLSDGRDPLHGSRAADLIKKQYAAKLDLNSEELDELYVACENHTKGWIEAPKTIQTCWDADRLDLWRVGSMPDRSRLCTEAAKSEEIIQWAVKRSNAWREARH